MSLSFRPILLAIGLLALAGCASHPATSMKKTAFIEGTIRVTEHRGSSDDLLTAGLGAAGLALPLLPPPADPAAPTAAELRRRALHANWRGIADLSPNGGYGTVYGSLAVVPGREYSAFARVPGASQPHRVLTQVPDGFDRGKRCLVVTASSGSRGIYGAIALAGAWGLGHGCAVAYTDKGAGTGYFDVDSRTGVTLDGTRAAAGSQPLEFEPKTLGAAEAGRVYSKHAHSGDHPEADWGRHVLQAMQFGLHALDQAFPELAPFTPENTRIIATGVSNGGGAVLRAAELEGGEAFDAVVAVAPNISVAGARPLLDYASEAALYQSCALLALGGAPALLPPAVWQPQAQSRCAALHAAGLLKASDPGAQAREALERLRVGGWSESALRLATINTSFDLWRAILATYVPSYLRAGTTPVCGYGFSARSADGSVKPSAANESLLWWSDSSGIPPGAGVLLVDSRASGEDPALPGLLCLQTLLRGDEPPAPALAEAIAQVRASAKPRSARVLLVHGGSDALIPIDFSARPYVAAAQAHGATVRLWEIERAQHFDAFLIAPAVSDQFPLLAFAYAGLDRMAAVLNGQAQMPESALIRPRQRLAGTPLTRAALMLP